MSLTVGQTVQHALGMPRKASSAATQPPRQSRDTTPADYKKAFLERIKSAREAMFKPDGDRFSQTYMAERLGIPQDKYKQYEVRSIMPAYLVVEFCKITDQHPWYILTGQSGSSSPGAFPTRPPPSLRTIHSEKPKSRPQR